MFIHTYHTSTPLLTGRGNIRLKYTAHLQTGEIRILEENHYYPYGLTHPSYPPASQTIGFDKSSSDITIIPTTPNVGDPYKYKYNGKEFQDELNLNVYDYGARNYMPDLGRFWQIDKKSDDILQVDLTPYNYSWNNPVNITDPDGNCPWCLGAVIGAIVDYSLQVANNYAQGKTGADAWTDVDLGSIAISAGAGATSGGLSTLKNIGTGTKVAINLGVDIIEESAQQVNQTGSVDAGQLATNVAIGKAFDVKLAKEVSPSEIKTAERKLDRAERVAGDNPRPSRAQAVKESKQEVNNLNNKKVVNEATNKTADGLVKGVTKSATNTTTGGTTGRERFKVRDERTIVRDNTRVYMQELRF